MTTEVSTSEAKTIPAVEKIDLSEVTPSCDDDSKSSGYNTALTTDKSPKPLPRSTGRWRGSDTSELQDLVSLDAILGSTIFTRRQHDSSLEESGRDLMFQKKFAEAALLLEAVYAKSFRQQLMLAECYLHTGKRDGVKVCYERAARLMTSSLRLRIHDVSAAIKKALDKKNYVKALLLLHCSPRFAYLKLVPNDAVFFIERRVADYSHAITDMVEIGGEQKELAEWFVKHNMLDILLLYREISRARFNKKIDCEARILTYFGLCYRAIGDHQKSLECFQQGLEVLNLSMKETVMDTKIYGTLLHNTGLEFEVLLDYAAAEAYYVQAFEALSMAGDFESSREKEVTVKVTATNLKILRSKMENLLTAKGDTDDSAESC